MRLRNIPGAREALAKSRFVVQDPEENRGQWRKFFLRDAPLFVEIGMGKGKFLREMAAMHPENLYIGIEMYSSVLFQAVQRAEREEERQRMERNYRFLRFDATEIESVFAPCEVDGIYLNFSDPWPKDRHAHRRLTSDRFLSRYRRILAPGGRLEFKTDNGDLFDYSLEMLRTQGWEILACTRDLYGIGELQETVAMQPESAAEPAFCPAADRETLLSGNIASEYEEKFAARGNAICKLIATPGESSATASG